MKFNLNNPAFLQAGGNKPMITRMVLNYDSGGQVQLSANGLVIVEYMQDGEKVRQTYSALSDTYVPIPIGVEATVYGSVTVINRDANTNVFSSLDVSKNTALTWLCCNGCTGFSSLDVSKNTALTDLDCGDCSGLTSLDVSKNTALTDLNCNACSGLTSLDVSKNTALTDLNCNACSGLTSLDVSKNTALTWLNCSQCSGLMLLDIQSTAQLEGGRLFLNTDTNITTLKLAGTSEWAYEQVEIWLNDGAPNDGKLYVDENTPQAVITAAESKDWIVEYVDA